MTGTFRITNNSIRSAAASNWDGDPGAEGKIQYHANRWYIVADSSSDRIVQFRRNGTDVSYIDNSGNFQGNAATASTLSGLSQTLSNIRINFPTSEGNGHSFGSSHYSMGKDLANGGWSHPHYGDLIIGYHTGIRIGAHYSGTRFYSNSPTTDANNDGNGDQGESLLMTVGGYVGTSHQDVYVNNVLYAGASMRTPIFYDSNDTAYYTDPNSTSRLNALTVVGGITVNRINARQSGISLGSGNSSQLEINNAASGACNISFHREGAYGAHFGLDTDNWFSTYGWSAGSGYTAMRVGSFSTSATGTATSDFRAPIFYDSNDTAYYTDPNSTSRLSTLRIVGNELYLSGGSPTMHFVDGDERGCALHNNSNLLYILSSNGTGGESWTQNNGQWPFYINLNNNNANFGGDITAVGNVTAYSDIKLKENIVSVDNGLGKVLAMRAVYYNMKSDSTKTKRIGVIAQEIQKILPEVVKLSQDPKEDPEGTLTVDYGNITAILIEAIKEQQSQIEKQQSQIDELKLLVQSINA
jgi:hypothetical protein